MVLLGQYAGIKAREHTTAPENMGLPAYAYNSSASVVNAIFRKSQSIFKYTQPIRYSWLTLQSLVMFNVFMISVLRAARPVFGIPSIQYIVFVIVRN